MSERYTKDHNIDSHPIVDSGVVMDKEAVLKRLNNLQIAADTMSEIMEALAEKAGIKTGDVTGLIEWIENLAPTDYISVSSPPTDELLNEKGWGLFRAFRPDMDHFCSRNGYAIYSTDFGWNDCGVTHWAPLLPEPQAET